DVVPGPAGVGVVPGTAGEHVGPAPAPQVVVPGPAGVGAADRTHVEDGVVPAPAVEVDVPGEGGEVVLGGPVRGDGDAVGVDVRGVGHGRVLDEDRVVRVVAAQVQGAGRDDRGDGRHEPVAEVLDVQTGAG